MKFSCDRCDAQYMISDEKVGPNGVKVRCKKCSHVILIRRAAENGATSGEAPTLSPVPAPSGEGLDAELGQAFDNAFGDKPAGADAAAPAGASTPAAPAHDPDSTQGVSAEEAASLSARSAPQEPAATEWYVAIGQAQVGPLPLAEVRRKWEAGDVGPDSLVWRPGMGDWAALKGVSDLAAYLAPVPRGTVRPKPAPSQTPAPTFGRSSSPVSGAAAQAVRADVTWKPVGASALAALASEELSSHAAEAKAEPKPVFSARSLVDALPDGGGVDPTGAIPLSIKALESTGEEPVVRSSVARGAEKLRKKRSSTRALVATIVVLFLGLVGVGGYAFKDQLLGIAGQPPQQPAAPVAVAPQPSPTPKSPEPQKPAEPPVTAAKTEAAQPAATPPATAKAEPAKAEPAKPEPAKAAEPSKAEPAKTAVAAAEPPRAAKGREKKTREPAARTPARSETSAPPPAAPAAPARPKKGGDVLDFDASSSDSALDDALGNGKTGRSVYVPPAPGGGDGVSERVTDSQVNETIMTRVSSLQQCLAENKSGGGGVLKMRWAISPEGAVQNLKCITPETANTPFASCVTGILKTLRFPKTQQGRSEVTFPFKF